MISLTKKMIAISAGVALFAGASTAFAAQPGQNCEVQTKAPAGFSTDGFISATLVYAGAGHSTVSGNDKAVSQYDVACYQLSN